jgi:hypothetical protein
MVSRFLSRHSGHQVVFIQSECLLQYRAGSETPSGVYNVPYTLVVPSSAGGILINGPPAR